MMHDFTDTIITNELKRIRKVGGQIDRGYLKRETGLKGDRLEAAISRNAVRLISEESVESKLNAQRQRGS